MISIDYKLEEAGWAISEIGNGKEIITITVSYLNDTLKQLAESAINIKKGNSKRIIFMDEPGEHHLVLNRTSENEIEYEVFWYDDWTDWNAIENEKFERVLSGKTSNVNYVNEVRKVLKNIWNEFGPEKYQQKWVNHEFPKNELDLLN